MEQISRGQHVHADRLERWLGAEQVARVSKAMRDFPYPIALHGVPGNVHVMPGGDFCGPMHGGVFASAMDRAMDSIVQLRRVNAAAVARHRVGSGVVSRERNSRRFRAFSIMSGVVTAAFSNQSSVINAETGGKGQTLLYQKTGTASNAIGNANDLWTKAGQPAAGSAAGAAPTGTTPTSATTGAITGYQNASSANLNHFTSGWLTASVVNNTLLMYDRLFAVAAGAALSGPTSTAVTGTQTRYTSTTPGQVNYCGGNFLFPSCTTVLAATAHNWAVGNTGPVGMVYTNQAGTTGKFLPVSTGVSACVAGGVDLAVGGWFMPYAAGDSGVLQLTNMQSSAAVGSGAIDFVIAHAIAFFPCPVANMICPVDGLNTAFNLNSIMDGACLSFLEMPKPATTATNYSGAVHILSE